MTGHKVQQDITVFDHHRMTEHKAISTLPAIHGVVTNAAHQTVVAYAAIQVIVTNATHQTVVA
ncbi:MAG: hypothetical protein EBT67_05470, partial [Betaproteobacteria bacterium]|nr:hypothetical protein [Betaproteobacteria bacterium]